MGIDLRVGDTSNIVKAVGVGEVDKGWVKDHGRGAKVLGTVYKFLDLPFADLNIP